MKLIILSILFIMSGCNSTKKATEQTNIQKEQTTELQSKEMNQELLDKGYKLGTVKEVGKGECAYIIVDEKTKVEFDPINFNEDVFKSMRKDNQKVYYKYFPLRMMNRCGNYQPVKIIDCKSY